MTSSDLRQRCKWSGCVFGRGDVSWSEESSQDCPLHRSRPTLINTATARRGYVRLCAADKAASSSQGTPDVRLNLVFGGFCGSLHLLHEDGFFNLDDGFCRIQSFGTSLRAVHDGMASVQTKGVVQLLESRLPCLIATVHDPARSLQENGWSQILLVVPPVTGTRRGTAET